MALELGTAINHTITIRPTQNRGFIVAVGCGHFVFADTVSLLDALKRYLDDPKKYEKLYGVHCAPVSVPQPDINVEMTAGSPARFEELRGPIHTLP